MNSRTPMTNQGTILVVDDTPANLKLLADTLTAEGYQVRPADSGELALADSAAHPPELILLDIRMPGLDGFEVCRRLRARAKSRDIPIMLISAFGESAERVEGLKLGAVDFITKPFQREELLARVQTHLELGRLRVRLEHQTADQRQANEQLQTELAERKRAEEALHRSETKFRTLYDSTSDAVMLLDEKGFFDCNPATLAMFGCATREEFCSKHPADVSPPVQPDGTDSLTLANQRIGTAMEKGSHHFEWMHQRADTGETFAADVLLSAMELDGKPVLQAVVRDITERKRMEEKLRQLSRAVEQSPASIVITDPTGNIEYVNPKFIQVTGYTLAEVLGKNSRVLKSGEKSPEAYRDLWQTITAGKEWRGEFHNKKKNGELYWESASISPIRDLAGRVTRYVAVKEDITARKQTEAERDQLIQNLQKALANVKSLSGLLPICAGCKKIRDDKGYWNQVESYVQKHSEATFTHGMCPDCIKKYFPGLEEAGPGDSPKEAP